MDIKAFLSEGRDSDGYINLSALKQGQESNMSIEEYLDLDTTKKKQILVSEDTGIPVDEIFHIENNGSTIIWGHPLMAIDCAMFLNAKFRLLVNQTIFMITDGDFTPKTDDARLAQDQVQQLWQELSDLELSDSPIDSFWFMGDEMKAYLDANVDRMSENEVKFYWSNAQDRINLALFGKRAWQIRQELGVNKSCQLRDMYGKQALKNIEMVQRLAAAHMSGQGMNPVDAIDTALGTWNIAKADYRQ